MFELREVWNTYMTPWKNIWTGNRVIFGEYGIKWNKSMKPMGKIETKTSLEKRLAFFG
jgi:hypothetical protein